MTTPRHRLTQYFAELDRERRRHTMVAVRNRNLECPKCLRVIGGEYDVAEGRFWHKECLQDRRENNKIFVLYGFVAACIVIGLLLYPW